MPTLTVKFIKLYNESMNRKNVTIDDLAKMVNKGFSGTDKRFDNITKEMRSGFQRVDRRFDKIESLILVEHRIRKNRLLGDF